VGTIATWSGGTEENRSHGMSDLRTCVCDKMSHPLHRYNHSFPLLGGAPRAITELHRESSCIGLSRGLAALFELFIFIFGALLTYLEEVTRLTSLSKGPRQVGVRNGLSYLFLENLAYRSCHESRNYSLLYSNFTFC
jgi:hypothetical protein